VTTFGDPYSVLGSFFREALTNVNPEVGIKAGDGQVSQTDEE
jgi:hypothetical protein